MHINKITYFITVFIELIIAQKYIKLSIIYLGQSIFIISEFFELEKLQNLKYQYLEILKYKIFTYAIYSQNYKVP